MKNLNNRLGNIRYIKSIGLLLLLLIMIHLVAGCSNRERPWITRVAPRGEGAVVQNIAWSPTDENKILVAAYQTPIQPTEIYTLDISTGQKKYFVEQPTLARLFEAKWTVDGKHVLIFSGGQTVGFEKAGWWKVDSENTVPEYMLPPDDAAWSPDGTIIAQLREANRGQVRENVVIKLIDIQTKTEHTIATYDGMDTTLGLSWSPDNKYVVFAIGRESHGDLYILERQSLQITKLTRDGKNRYPAWSPRGNIIAFVVDLFSIHLISQDGRCRLALPTPGSAWSPTWSPDGKKLAYVSTDGIYVLDLEEALGRDIYQGLCP